MSPVPVDPATAVAHTDATAADINARFLKLFRTFDGADIGIDIANIAATLKQLFWQPGMISITAAATADAGFLLCDGSAVSRTTYSALFARIGTAFGTGNGTTTFNLPDYQGRTAIGSGTGSGLAAKTLGAKVGTEPSNMPSHAHGGATGASGVGGAHGHTAPATIDGGTSYNVSGEVTGSGGGDIHTHTIAANGAGSATDGNVPPSTVANYQIKT